MKLEKEKKPNIRGFIFYVKSLVEYFNQDNNTLISVFQEGY